MSDEMISQRVMASERSSQLQEITTCSIRQRLHQVWKHESSHY